MRLSSVLLLAFAGLFLAGCATLNKNECLSADWQVIGYEDGSRGFESSRIQQHREACAKHSISPDLSAYQQGYQQGILEFCTERNGYQRGLSGYNYKGICPAGSESNFLRGYDVGKEIHAMRSKISNIKSELRRLENDLEELGDSLDAMEAEMVSDETTSERRMELINLRDKQLKEKTILEDDILDAKLAVAKAEGELEQLQQKSPY